ncbi:hypothetical protein M1N79_01745 [Dehalococcoidia bacterium]|nr:hypothetical protein [Dehalococcoidia bacterium]
MLSKIQVFNLFSGFLAALAVLILIGRLDSYHGTFGTGMEMHTLAAVILGGTAPYGGIGRLWGSLAEAVLISMLINGMVLLRFDFFWQQIAVSVVILLAVMPHTLTSFRESRGVGGYAVSRKYVVGASWSERLCEI